MKAHSQTMQDTQLLWLMHLAGYFGGVWLRTAFVNAGVPRGWRCFRLPAPDPAQATCCQCRDSRLAEGGRVERPRLALARFRNEGRRQSACPSVWPTRQVLHLHLQCFGLARRLLRYRWKMEPPGIAPGSPPYQGGALAD